jgi:2-hydroxy-3-oxopropionate reductase
MKLGFIGLGIMGAPMAEHLIAGGHQVYLYSIPSVPQALVEKGGIACASGKEVAQQADVIITMVPDTPHVEAALFGKDGVAEGLASGKLVVDMSSISPIATKEFAKRINALGCDYLDAPVSGGEVGAKNATLSIMVGGPEAAFTKARPLLELMGKNITLVGGNGDGQTTKVANQIIVALTIEAVGEALVFASKAGADPAKVRQALMGGFASSYVRAGFSHRTAPEGSEPRAANRQDARRVAAQHRHCAGTVQRLRRAWRSGLGPFGDGARAGAHGQSRDWLTSMRRHSTLPISRPTQYRDQP